MKARAILGLMLLATSAVWADADPYLARRDVRAAVASVRRDTWQNGLRIEYAIIVRPETALHSLDWSSGTREDVPIYFPWDNQILAIFHTHLDKGFERPSETDRELAIEHRTPIYVISQFAIWKVAPDGEVSLVEESKH